jgi:hypothetical protein
MWESTILQEQVKDFPRNSRTRIFFRVNMSQYVDISTKSLKDERWDILRRAVEILEENTGLTMTNIDDLVFRQE